MPAIMGKRLSRAAEVERLDSGGGGGEVSPAAAAALAAASSRARSSWDRSNTRLKRKKKN
jgi:hypothetical protein